MAMTLVGIEKFNLLDLKGGRRIDWFYRCEKATYYPPALLCCTSTTVFCAKEWGIPIMQHHYDARSMMQNG